jgi:hypothetical protein
VCQHWFLCQRIYERSALLPAGIFVAFGGTSKEEMTMDARARLVLDNPKCGGTFPGSTSTIGPYRRKAYIQLF